MKEKSFEIKVGKKNVIINNLTHLNFDLDYSKDWDIIKSIPDKRILVDWAIKNFKVENKYFYQTSEILPFIKSKIEVRNQVVKFDSPEYYYNLLTKHLKDDWFINYRFDEYHGTPNITILLRDIFDKEKKYNSTIKKIIEKSLNIYLKNNYSFNRNDKTISNNVILIQKDEWGFIPEYQMHFDVYLLLTPEFITYAFLEKKSLNYLETGIYEITGRIANMNGETGFIIKKAKQIKKTDDKNIFKKGYKKTNNYEFKLKIKIYSIFKKLKNQIKIIKSSLFGFLKKQILNIIRLAVILGGIYGFYQLIGFIISSL